jgi:DNA repair protein RadC
VALYLDGAHTIIAYSVVFTGTANSCQVHAREIFQCAVLVGAVAVVVGHNHPSGEVSPSSEDLKVTKQLQDAGGLLGIKVLDHVIVTDLCFHSFTEGTRS